MCICIYTDTDAPFLKGDVKASSICTDCALTDLAAGHPAHIYTYIYI